MAEQVSHHPPISAFYCEHVKKRIAVNAHIYTKSSFLGMSVSIFWFLYFESFWYLYKFCITSLSSSARYSLLLRALTLQKISMIFFLFKECSCLCRNLNNSLGLPSYVSNWGEFAWDLNLRPSGCSTWYWPRQVDPPGPSRSLTLMQINLN